MTIPLQGSPLYLVLRTLLFRSPAHPSCFRYSAPLVIRYTHTHTNQSMCVCVIRYSMTGPGASRCEHSRQSHVSKSDAPRAGKRQRAARHRPLAANAARAQPFFVSRNGVHRELHRSRSRRAAKLRRFVCKTSSSMGGDRGAGSCCQCWCASGGVASCACCQAQLAAHLLCKA